MEPQKVGYLSWVYLGVAAMMWAHSAIDETNLSHPQRRYLSDIGAELRIPPRLALTPEARQAAWRAGRDRTDSRWAESRIRSTSKAKDSGSPG